MLSESKYLADFLVGFLGKKPQTLLFTIYSTTILYDNLQSIVMCRGGSNQENANMATNSVHSL